MISECTRAALAAAKKRGVKLGGYRGTTITTKMSKAAQAAVQERVQAWTADLAPIINELRAGGATTLQAIAEGLNERGIPAARGGRWSSPQVMRVLERVDESRPFVGAAA
jgi:DNA invertase Pin-like site-specific DNA recombinase